MKLKTFLLLSTLLLCSMDLAATALQIRAEDVSVAKDSIQTYLIDEVEVTANRNMQRLNNGGLITEVRNSALSELGTCRDVLSQLPGVKLNDGQIELVGRGIPQIYINGRRLIEDSELDRISSKEIRNVEVIFSPGAKYGAETRGVILIKTLGKPGDGISCSMQASGRQARFFSQSDNIFLNYRIGGLDFFGALSFDHYQRYQKQRDVIDIHTAEADYLVRSNMQIFPEANTYSANLGANWQFDGNNFIGIRYEYTATPDSRSHWSKHESVSGNHSIVSEVSYDTNWKGWSAPLHLINQYYQGEIGDFSISVNNDFLYRSQSNNQSVIEKNLSGSEQMIGSVNRIKSRMFASKGMAEYSFGDNTLEFGYEVTATDRNDVFRNEGIALRDADDRIKETTGAAFISVNIPIKNVELYTGLRYEHTSSDYYQYGLHVSEQSRIYSRLYPNIDFTFPIKHAKFTLSYESKTKRPLYSQLSSSIQYDDRFTYETGNPLLKPERLHILSLAGIYKWIFFSAAYTYDADAIISVIRPYSPDEPQNIMTYENFNHLMKYNVVLSLSPKISRWSPRLRLNLLGQRFSMETINGTTELNTPILFINFFNGINLGKGFSLNADASVRTCGDMDVVTLKPSWQLNLGLSKNLENWFFQLQANDLFKTARNSMVTHGYQMTLDKWNYSDSQAIRLMIRYSFNTATSKYKGKGAGQSEKNRL